MVVISSQRGSGVGAEGAGQAGALELAVADRVWAAGEQVRGEPDQVGELGDPCRDRLGGAVARSGSAIDVAQGQPRVDRQRVGCWNSTPTRVRRRARCAVPGAGRRGCRRR